MALKDYRNEKRKLRDKMDGRKKPKMEPYKRKQQSNYDSAVDDNDNDDYGDDD